MPCNPLESHILNFIGLIYSGLFKRRLSGERERDDKRGGVDVKLSFVKRIVRRSGSQTRRRLLNLLNGHNLLTQNFK